MAVADIDEGLTGLGDLEERREDLLMTAGVAAMLEGVEVAFGWAGAWAAAAPLLFSHG